MRKSWSREWKSSRQPRKQRKYVYNAPLHVRGKLVSGHLSKTLRTEMKRRSVPLRKGDEVLILTGDNKGRSGKINRVDRAALKVYIEGIKVRKVSGQEVDIPVSPANIIVTSLFMEDKKRIASIKRPAKILNEQSAKAGPKEASK